MCVHQCSWVNSQNAVIIFYLLTQPERIITGNNLLQGSVNKLQVYFTNRSFVFKVHTKFEFNKSIFKFPLQASAVFCRVQFSCRTSNVQSMQKVHLCMISLLNRPLYKYQSATNYSNDRGMSTDNH